VEAEKEREAVVTEAVDVAVWLAKRELDELRKAKRLDDEGRRILTELGLFLARVEASRTQLTMAVLGRKGKDSLDRVAVRSVIEKLLGKLPPIGMGLKQ